MKKIIEVQIAVGFEYPSKSIVWKKGVGVDFQSAIQDLFNRKHNYIQKDEMVLVYKELIKTKAKEFKQ